MRYHPHIASPQVGTDRHKHWSAVVALAYMARGLFHDVSFPPVGATASSEATRRSDWDTVSHRGLGEGRIDTAPSFTPPHALPFSVVSLRDRSFFGNFCAFEGIFCFVLFCFWRIGLNKERVRVWECSCPTEMWTLTA